MLAPVLEQLSEEIEDVKFVKINAADEDISSGFYGVAGVPALVLLKDGEEQARRVGLVPAKALKQWIVDSI